MLTFYALYPCGLLLRLLLLRSLSASISLALFGEPRPPQNGRTQTLCLSYVFFVPEGLCQLVVLSVRLERPLLNLGDCLDKFSQGFSNLFLFFD
jgi:hypothetical protein